MTIQKPILPQYLDNIIVVLSRTSHPSNIGSAARAMKTMGLSKLTLVKPQLIATPMTPIPPIFNVDNPSLFELPEESFILASGARDVLENAKVVTDLKDALADTAISCALTSRRRELTAPLKSPRESIPEVLQVAQSGQQVALVFGNETFGLSIDEVQCCNRLMTISGNPDYFSLNLSQAVQVVCYELFSQINLPMNHLKQENHFATNEKVLGMVAHLEEVMAATGFFNRRNEKRLMRRMYNLFSRASVENEDIDILRGLFSSIIKKLK